MADSILVLGGGFAGLAAVRELARHRRRGMKLTVRLIDRRPYSVFSPLLPDLISQRVRPEHICLPLEPHCRRMGVEFVQADVRGIATTPCRVDTDAGQFSADYLIISLGCETNYFGSSEAQARTIGLKSLEEARSIRERAREMARRPAASTAPGHLVVVGGGYTGFEAASHAAHLLHTLTGRPYTGLRSVCRIIVADKGDEPLMNCPPRVRRWAVDLVQGYGIEVRTGTTLEAFEGERAVRLSDGSVLRDATVVWAAGVTPGKACASLQAPRTGGGRLLVDQYLRLPETPNAFAAGDVAGPTPPGAKQALRMSVQFSLAGGTVAASNVVRSIQGKPLLPFRPFDPGYVVPLAPGQAAGVVLGRELVGRVPQMLHYVMCALRSWGWSNRWGVLSDTWARRPAPAAHGDSANAGSP